MEEADNCSGVACSISRRAVALHGRSAVHICEIWKSSRTCLAYSKVGRRYPLQLIQRKNIFKIDSTFTTRAYSTTESFGGRLDLFSSFCATTLRDEDPGTTTN